MAVAGLEFVDPVFYLHILKSYLHLQPTIFNKLIIIFEVNEIYSIMAATTEGDFETIPLIPKIISIFQVYFSLIIVIFDSEFIDATVSFEFDFQLFFSHILLVFKCLFNSNSFYYC